MVTAAHCVLGTEGRLSATSIVLADGTERAASAVFVNLDYHVAPSPRLDAAVLVMADNVAGPAAIISDQLPEHGALTVAGLQPIDTDGSLLRGTNAHDRPLRNGATGPITTTRSAPAGCVLDRTELSISEDRLTAPCGLIPGASGGGLFAEIGNHLLLLGIISTVADDLSSNGLTPATAINDLLADPHSYRHEIRHSPSDASLSPVDRR